MSIHSSAIVSAAANIDPTAQIGPYCIIDGEVSIGAHTVVESNARIGSRFGSVTIGAHNHIQHGAVLGGPPQDLAYLTTDAYTALQIGSNNRIGEYVSIHVGTRKGGGVTRIGDRNFIMAYVHIGHDCQFADDIIVTNGTQFAGHVTVEHHALVSGLAGVSQFVRLGCYSFLTAGSFANKDIAPYTIAEGHWAVPRALNRVGLKRAGFDAAERKNLERALRYLLDRSLTAEQAASEIEERCSPSAALAHFVAFIRSSQRGLARRD